MNNAPIKEAAGDAWPSSWVQWFAGIVLALGGWRKTIKVTQSLDFSSISAQSQEAISFSIRGARQGDSVLVTPTADVFGLAFSGLATSKDLVTIYAKNFTAGAINPAAQDFQIIIFQS